LLWNDTRSAESAADLVSEIGESVFLEQTGSIPVASFTITKLRWLRDNEPQNASRVAAIALPHDWLSWRIRGFGPKHSSALGPDFDQLCTDRSDASGTGYFNSRTNEYLWSFVETALGHRPKLPRILSPNDVAGLDIEGRVYACGAGDNAAAALALALRGDDAVVSIGTSGTIFASTESAVIDSTATLACFSDARGGFLPIAVTINASKVLEHACSLLKVNFEQLSQLALTAPVGSEGLVLLPYFAGERTPNLPNATASLNGITATNLKPENLARAFVEGMLCGLRAGLESLRQNGVSVKRILLIGGGAQSVAVQQIAATVLDAQIVVAEPAEYVAEGATLQAARAFLGEAPNWPAPAFKYINGEYASVLVKNYERFANGFIRGHS